MYDWPEIRSSWDRLWSLVCKLLREQNIPAPERLIHVDAYQPLWTDPGLLLGQTCGWPFVSGLHKKVGAFARFDFALPEIPMGYYQSVFLMRDQKHFENLLEIGELIKHSNPLVAINDINSQSGFRVLGECFNSPFQIAREHIIISNSHRQSIRLLASGKAGLCAVDANSWRYALEHEPSSQSLHVAALSNPVPGLPLIASKNVGIDPQKIYLAVESAIAKLPETDRKCLGLAGLVPAGEEDYRLFLDPPFGNFQLAN